MKFPVDAPKRRVLSALRKLGFVVVREGNHISLARQNADGTTFFWRERKRWTYGFLRRPVISRS